MYPEKVVNMKNPSHLLTSCSKNNYYVYFLRQLTFSLPPFGTLGITLLLNEPVRASNMK
jgi:hypothetical protein